MKLSPAQTLALERLRARLPSKAPPSTVPPLAEPKFTFDGRFHRRLGYSARERTTTRVLSHAAAKADKFALVAQRVDNIRPALAPDYAYRNAGLRDNVRRF